jgi:hypothetical protein
MGPFGRLVPFCQFLVDFFSFDRLDDKTVVLGPLAWELSRIGNVGLQTVLEAYLVIKWFGRRHE